MRSDRFVTFFCLVKKPLFDERFEGGNHRSLNITDNVTALTDDNGEPEPELDEFGRLVPRNKKPAEPIEKHKWPPCFCDKHATEYVLDARSGMFYHAGCEFFYDPKSKLYYGSKQQRYFSHLENSTCQYVPVENGEHGATVQAMTVEPEVILDTSARPVSSSSASTATIFINLKTKKLPAKKKSQQIKHSRDSLGSTETTASTSITLAPSSSAVAKQHCANIGKWEERRQELATTTTAAVPPALMTTTTTKSGAPVCLLCKRKFQSLEQLARHEAVSQLHKDNLLLHQAKTAESLTSTASATQYVDRARNRRELHGTTTDTNSMVAATITAGLIVANHQAVGSSIHDATDNTDTASFDPLGAQNVGRKMLQGMGWTNEAEDDSKRPTQHGITKEWDRIESSMNRAQNQQRRYR
ncbi:hypothetical protein MPSEU_001087800 [Mayamaea pseudoterrestris]|nr:hypothetical protein MPSEU_001087800 [Mayamaea pseudoterrestris]